MFFPNSKYLLYFYSFYGVSIATFTCFHNYYADITLISQLAESKKASVCWNNLGNILWNGSLNRKRLFIFEPDLKEAERRIFKKNDESDVFLEYVNCCVVMNPFGTIFMYIVLFWDSLVSHGCWWCWGNSAIRINKSVRTYSVYMPVNCLYVHCTHFWYCMRQSWHDDISTSSRCEL